MSSGKVWRAFIVAALLTAVSGVMTPALAGADKAVLLAGLDRDRTMVRSWVLQVQLMDSLGTQRAPILADVSSASASVDALYNKTLGDSGAAALNADLEQTIKLQSALTSLEGPKVQLASRANAARAQWSRVLQVIKLSGGLDPHSPIHAQTMSIVKLMNTARSNLDQGVALLGQATLGTFPASRGLLVPAGSLIDRARAALQTANQFALNLKLSGPTHTQDLTRLQIDIEFAALMRLRTQVLADPNLNAGERANLLGQISASITAIQHLYACVIAAGPPGACRAQFSALFGDGVFFLIGPKADIMLAGAAARTAIGRLSALLPTLQSRIDAAATHRDVTALRSLLADMTAQLAGAGAEISPIDAEFESMTAITATQRSHVAHVIQATVAALRDANNRLIAARNDANRILAATA